MESMELAATIRREYPKTRVTMIDDNKEPVLAERYGEKVSRSLIAMQQNRGVEFVLGRRCLKYEGEDGRVKKIVLKGREVETDYVLYFPNNIMANTSLLTESPYREDMYFDRYRRMGLEVDLNSRHNRVFGAGPSGAPLYFLTQERITECPYNMSIEQGAVVAYNLLGLVGGVDAGDTVRHGAVYGLQLLRACVQGGRVHELARGVSD